MSAKSLPDGSWHLDLSRRSIGGRSQNWTRGGFLEFEAVVQPTLARRFSMTRSEFARPPPRRRRSGGAERLGFDDAGVAGLQARSRKSLWQAEIRKSLLSGECATAYVEASPRHALASKKACLLADFAPTFRHSSKEMQSYGNCIVISADVEVNAMADTKKLVTTGALAALFAALGAIGTAVFNNWDHIFGHPSPAAQSMNVNAQTVHDVTQTTANNVNGPNFQNIHGNINVGKGSEFYKRNGIRIHLPVGLPLKPHPKILTVATNESNRRIRNFDIALLEGAKGSGTLLAKSQDTNLNPTETTSPMLLEVANLPNAVFVCASYEAETPGRFVTLTVPTEKKVVKGVANGDHYQTSGEWNIYYSDRPSDCDRKGNVEPIAATDYFG